LLVSPQSFFRISGWASYLRKFDLVAMRVPLFFLSVALINPPSWPPPSVPNFQPYPQGSFWRLELHLLSLHPPSLHVVLSTPNDFPPFFLLAVTTFFISTEQPAPGTFPPPALLIRGDKASCPIVPPKNLFLLVLMAFSKTDHSFFSRAPPLSTSQVASLYPPPPLPSTLLFFPFCLLPSPLKDAVASVFWFLIAW